MAIVWKEFINRSHITQLPMNEQLRLFNIENKRLIDQKRQRDFLIKINNYYKTY